MAEIKIIVVGVDGSDSSREALRWAYDEAAHHSASVTAVSCWHPPAMPMTPPYGSLPPEGYAEQPRQEALDLIERSKEADLVVLGSRGHGGFKGMLLGSVSQHLVAHAECPVVVVR